MKGGIEKEERRGQGGKDRRIKEERREQGGKDRRGGEEMIEEERRAEERR